MEFSAFFIFAVCTTSMTCLTFRKERERAMLFPDYYFFSKRRLENYTIETRKVKNLDDCELMCYLNDDCVSLNFKKDPDNNEAVHICELNNATHLKNDSDLTTDAKFYYRGSKNACDKNSQCENNATCQSGFTVKGYQCLCPPGFEGERCEKDIDECSEAHADKVNECHSNASCINTQGSYSCSCNRNLIGDGFECEADPCHHYKNLSDANRKISYETPVDSELCDSQLSGGWYRFVGAAGTTMPTTRVPAFKCGTKHSGWLDGAHPTVKDREVARKVCFSARTSGCEHTAAIFVKNCGLYFIYKLQPTVCYSRFCATD